MTKDEAIHALVLLANVAANAPVNLKVHTDAQKAANDLKQFIEKLAAKK